MFNKLDTLKDNLLFKLLVIKKNLWIGYESLLLMSVCIFLNFWGQKNGLRICFKATVEETVFFFPLENNAASDHTFSLYAHFLEHVAPVFIIKLFYLRLCSY